MPLRATPGLCGFDAKGLILQSLNRRRVFAAIDLGASSGRVIAGVLTAGSLDVVEIRRFPTTSTDDGPLMRWDIQTIYAETLRGLRDVQELCAQESAQFSGIGIDSWGVDYGLLARGVVDLSDVRHHRKAGVIRGGYENFATTVEERYRITGILDQSINTLPQLSARLTDGTASDESVVLFVPDIWAYLLAGAVGTDPTIASTSQLLDLRTGDWSDRLVRELEPTGVSMPGVSIAGSYAGATTSPVTELIGAPAPVPVFRVAGHDTASGLGFSRPAGPGESTSGVISSGTWSLAGLAVERPVVSEQARTAGFTTERGLRGFLMVKNLSGMWLLQECLRTWREQGVAITPQEATDAAAASPTHSAVIDLTDPRLLAPGDMPERIVALAAEAGRTPAVTHGDITRVILDSLAAAYASSIDEAAQLTGVTVDQIRIIGGGSQNGLLCQQTADRSGLPVIAGPSEATAIGNLITQVWAAGIVETIDDAYALLTPTIWSTTTYTPTESQNPR